MLTYPSRKFDAAQIELAMKKTGLDLFAAGAG